MCLVKDDLQNLLKKFFFRPAAQNLKIIKKIRFLFPCFIFIFRFLAEVINVLFEILSCVPRNKILLAFEKRMGLYTCRPHCRN